MNRRKHGESFGIALIDDIVITYAFTKYRIRYTYRYITIAVAGKKNVCDLRIAWANDTKTLHIIEKAG